MSFLTELATKLTANFSKITHNHDSAYEAKNSNIQAHIANSSNPHVVTKTQIGLGSVTDNKQINASASSVNNEIAIWDGTTGDALKGGYTIETSALGSASTSLPVTSVVYTAIQNISSGIGGAVLPGVADITALRAINTSNSSSYPDKALILVEATGLYRLDRDSEASESGDFVIAPTTGVGRWIMLINSASDHSLLAGLQGGTTSQYYHLTASQFQSIPSGVSSTNLLLASDNGKFTYLTSAGTFPVAQVTATTTDWAEFTTALG